MKTSNYIITAFLTFLFGGVLVMAVAAKFHKETNKEIQYRSEEKRLEPFSVIVAESGAHFQISTAENPHIESFYQLPDSCQFPPYGIRNDTLFVLVDSTTNRPVAQDVIYCKNIKSIVAKENTHLIFQDFKIADNDTVILKSINSKINMSNQDTKNKNGALFFLSQQSEIYLNGVHFKTIDVKIDQSKIIAWNFSLRNLSGTLINHSEMHSPAVMGKISLEIDSTSHINLYK